MQTTLINTAHHGGQILLTHEHPDHIGGILKSKNFEALAKITTITKEQIEAATPLFDDKASIDYFSPIDYSGIISPAPGVVIQKAGGHSPGSQIVYVALQDGREFLFAGDIAWDYTSIKTGVSRPLIVSLLFLHEDRQSVADQLLALQKLAETEPNLNIVVAHDANQLEELRLKNIVTGGFNE
ncbi:MAG: MBL fold metallo-hydrolase [Leptonema sp. (in: Bacteria)]|nr:MBL fold metallo-hydrolase [Leptonema sp. (in: bacteria)]